MTKITALSRMNKREIDQLFATVVSRKAIDGLLLLLSPRQGSHARILIITPKKVGNAPQRNRIRRQLKAIFYEEKMFEGAYDCAALAKAPVLKHSFAQLRDFLTKTLTASPEAPKISSETPRE